MFFWHVLHIMIGLAAAAAYRRQLGLLHIFYIFFPYYHRGILFAYSCIFFAILAATARAMLRMLDAYFCDA